MQLSISLRGLGLCRCLQYVVCVESFCFRLLFRPALWRSSLPSRMARAGVERHLCRLSFCFRVHHGNLVVNPLLIRWRNPIKGDICGAVRLCG
jgi:hypothetical protein